ncbi:MAG: hypothetical protein ACR2IE_14115 [Candidatus Sumerlaeaceae bacterium]
MESPDEPRLNRQRQLRIVAITLWVIGAALCAVGAVNIISTYVHLIDHMDSIGGNPTGDTPPYAWCIYAGLPPLAIGTAIRFYIKTRRW